MQNRSLTYRSSSGQWIVIASSILAAFFIVDALVRGFWGVATVTLLWAAAIIGMLVITLVRPHLHTDESAVTIVSPMRTTRIPWTQVSAIVSNRLLSVEARDGRRFTLFDAPGQKAKNRAEASHDLADELRTLQREHGSDAPARSHTASSEMPSRERDDTEQNDVARDDTARDDAALSDTIDVRSHRVIIVALIAVWAAAVLATIVI